MDYRIVDAIKCYLKGEQFNTTVDEELINTALEQSLTALLYTVTLDKSLKKYYINQVMIQEKFIMLQEELTSIFNKNGIKHFYIKGANLYNLYPDSAIRSRGDIDVYVGKSQVEKAYNLMIDNGYISDNSPALNHYGLLKNGMEVELHFALFNFATDKFDDYIKVFDDPFKFTYVYNEYQYKLTDTMHLVYWLCHLRKHLKLGVGLRYLIDFYYMNKKTNIDYDLLHEYIDEFGMQTLYNNLLNAIYYLTNETFDSFEKEDVTFLFDYMIKKGIHGFADYDPKKTIYNGNHKYRYLFRIVFMPDKEFRLGLYPKGGKHWYCYPFILIHRIIKLIFTRTGKFFRYLFGRKNKEQEALYKKLGA